MTHVHPTRDDRVVAAVSEVVGGPVGEHAGRHRWWTPARVLLLLTAITFVLGMAQKAPCSLADGKDQPWVYSHMCYTDLRPLYVPRGLAELSWPYDDDEETRDRYDAMEYPVGISYWAYGAAWVTQVLNGSPDRDARSDQPVDELAASKDVDRELTIFVLVNAVGFAALALLSVWLLSKVDRGRPWDAAAFALSPTLILTGLINWDLIAVALVAAALWSWSRDRPVLTGLLIGLGTAAKLYPLFLLGGLLIICIRQRRYGAFALATVWAAVTWSLVNLPAYLSGPDTWKVFWSFNADRGADLGSVWLIIDQVRDSGVGVDTINLASWIFFGVWCAGVLVLGLLAGRRTGHVPRLAQLGFLIVVGFLLINKVYSPQYVLWLLPLAVLARPRWRDQIIWQAGEVFYFCTVWWYLGNYLQPAGGGDVGFYWVGIAVRMACELYLAAVIVRDMLAPNHDPTGDRPEPEDLADVDPVEGGGGVAHPHVDPVADGRHAGATR
ncbi:glycosyltransferase 87 family protein [Nocardioides sp. HM23]|uniref:glycosyltransferase family 87 protein n=1 Tax=Nocardioides bizhenqiangii TaxID=3095076 RepID=UPI002ACA43BB|nr:glycosyltransferase 87 family protein [Nocardioides sp. HM23]MDZ5619372.1 glycosyltransferase 87 family protein [Nocardioides sp. HM23]